MQILGTHKHMQTMVCVGVPHTRWPSQISDLDPIGLVWDKLDCQLQAKGQIHRDLHRRSVWEIRYAAVTYFARLRILKGFAP